MRSKLVAVRAPLVTALVSSVLAACGGAQEGTTLPSEPVLSGFVVDHNAFPFRNFGGRDPSAKVFADSASRMFGASAVCANADDMGEDGCRLTPIAKTWMKNVNDAMEGGRCEGFAVLSGLLFLGAEDPATFGATSARDLSLEDNEKLGREIAYWFSSQYLIDVINETTHPVTATEAVRFLADAFAAGQDMYRLGIMRIDENGQRRGGHAILPVAVVPGAEAGHFIIKVYDNNFPDVERDILVDTEKNRWEYQASTSPDAPLSLYWGSPENGNLLFLSPVKPRLGTHPCPFCVGDEQTQAQALAQVFALGSAEVTVSNASGAETGIKDGKLVEGFVGASVPPMFTNGDNSKLILVPVRDGVSVNLRGGASELPLEVSVFGAGFNTTITDATAVVGRADRLTLSADGSDIQFLPSTTTGPSIAMARVTRQGTQTVVKLKLPEGMPITTVSMQVNTETGDAGIQARAEGDVPLQIEVTRSTGEGEDTFQAEIVAPAEGAVEIGVSEWEGEGAPMPVGVDPDGSGNFEPTEIVSTGPPGVGPDAPTGLVGVVEAGGVVLTWQDASTNEESFTIERDAGLGFEVVGTTAPNVATFTDPNVIAGRSYDYRVRAENRYDVSGWTEVVRIKIPGCPAGEQDKDGDGTCAPDCATSGVSCGSNGSCSDASGAAVCVCAAGYAGATCGTCAAGYQDKDNNGTCAPDCATSGVSCGSNGSCNDASGAAVCVCAAGYAGATCGTCAAGYQDQDNNGTCAPDCATSGVSCGSNGSCSDTSGAAVCVCAAGYAGATCGTCAAGYQDQDNDGTCAPDCATSAVSCGSNGSCSDASGAAVCVCATGYTGATCGTCAAGYQDQDNNGTCAPDCATSGVSCGSNGSCSDASGAAACVCTAGYAGATCGTCAAGYQDQDNNGTCAPDCATSGVSCGSNGSCSDASGAAVCICAIGYTGATCGTCAAGYQDKDANGTCAPDCATSGLSCGTNGSCEDTSGTAVCACVANYRWVDGACVPDSPLLALYRFDGGAPGADSGGRALDLVVNGDAHLVDEGRYGKGLYLDGNGDFLGANAGASAGLPGLPSGDASYAISAWFKVSDGGARGIVGWGAYGSPNQVTAIRTASDQSFSHYWWARDLGATVAPFVDGQFHHVLVMYDAGTGLRSIVYDGALAASDSPGPHDAQNIAFTIGKTFGGEYFYGTLDDVAIFDRALSGAEIAAVMSGDYTAFQPECPVGFTGATCQACADGLRRDGASCVPAAARCTSLTTCELDVVAASDFSVRRVAFSGDALALTPNVVGFDASGSFVVPDGVTSLEVYALGAGGGGQNDFGPASAGGSAARSVLAVTPGQTIEFTVGAGGVGGNSPSAGGDTIVTVGEARVVGGGGSVSGTRPSEGEVVVPGGGGSGSAGGNVGGVCSAGGGARSVDEGPENHRVGGAGGCFPAGSGGHGASQYGSVVMPGGSGPNFYLMQPGGDGGEFGGGGGSGGNYNGRGGDGGGGYVQLSWTATPAAYPVDVQGVAVTVGAQFDTSSWSGLGAVTPDVDTDAGQVSYAVSFDNRRSFSVHDGVAWRRIVRSLGTDQRPLAADNTQWQVNAAANAGDEDWFDCSSNALDACLEDAFSLGGANLMTDLQAVSAAAWDEAFVPGTLDFAFGFRADTSGASPRLRRLDIHRKGPVPGLVHCWSGDGNGDDLYGGDHATVYADVSFAEGVSGQAFQCTGVSGATAGVAVSEGPNVSPLGPWTFDFWIHYSSGDGGWVFDRVVPGSPLVSLFVGATGGALWYLRSDDGGGPTIGGFTLPDAWTHLAITRGGGVYTAYMNGVEVGTAPDPGTALTPDPPKWCSHSSSDNQGMNGLFDTVRIWDRALTPEEIDAAAHGDGSCEAH